MDLANIPYIGEFFALMAPLCWSIAVILFRKTGEIVSPIALNLFKNTLAINLFVLTAVFFGEGVFRDVPTRDYLLLIISGVLGIGVADSLFFAALNRIGAGLWAIVNTGYSPSIIMLSIIFLGERLTIVQSLGVLLIVSAVLTIVWMKEAKGGIEKKKLISGIILGLSALFAQAISVVMIKPLLDNSPLFWANSWRLLGGLLSMVFVVAFFKRERMSLSGLKNIKIYKVMVPAAIIGTYVSLGFWLAGMKYTQASTASALNQSSSLFTFILAAILLKEPVTKKRVMGLAIGVVGVILVTFGA